MALSAKKADLRYVSKPASDSTTCRLATYPNALYPEIECYESRAVSE